MPAELRAAVAAATTIGSGYREHAAHESMTWYLEDWEEAHARLGRQIEALRALRDERREAKESGRWPERDKDRSTMTGET